MYGIDVLKDVLDGGMVTLPGYCKADSELRSTFRLSPVSWSWKNCRNSNMHRAISMKTADLFAEVILIDDANHHAQGTFGDSQEVKTLAASFNQNNKRKRPSYPICFGCNQPGHVVSECPDAQEPYENRRYCHEDGHIIEDRLKLRWQNEQRRTKRTKSNGNQSREPNGKQSIEYRPSFELPKSVNSGKPPGRFPHSANTINMIYGS